MSSFFQTGLIGDEYVPGDAQAALIIVHGLGEHRGRYRSAVERLTTSGIACFAYDQRGHGESPGLRTDVRKFSDFTEDLAGVVKGVAASYPALRTFLWGHSLGSIVVLNYVLDAPDGIRGGITTGCPLVTLPKVISALSKAGTRFCDLLPTIRVDSRINPEYLSYKEDVQAAYMHDPLVSKSLTLKLVFELSQAINRLKKHTHEIEVPWLAVHGGEDQIAPPEGSRRLIEALGSDDKTLVVMDGLRHEVHNESDAERGRFFRLITRWTKQRAGKR